MLTIIAAMHRFVRHLLILLAILLPLQGMAGVLMLNCEHKGKASEPVVMHDAHGNHHGHQASANSEHASHGHHAAKAGADALSCDDCDHCDLCGSPALSALAELALVPPAGLVAPTPMPALHSVILDDPQRPPRLADRA